MKQPGLGAAALAAVFLVACSTPNGTLADGSVGDAAQGDGPLPSDAPRSDAPPSDAPLPGAACLASPREVARLGNAVLWPDDRGFYGRTYKQGLYTRDATGDGKADILSVEFSSGTVGAYVYKLRLFIQDVSGFADPVESTVTLPGNGPLSNAVADVNGDHRLDVLFTWETDSWPRRTYVYVALQDQEHDFSLRPSVNFSACGSSSDERLFGYGILDVDRDGRDDVLATMSYGGLGSNPSGLTLLRGGSSNLDAASCVASASVTTAGIPAELAAASGLSVADFDLDGHSDLVAWSADNQLTHYRNTGASTFVEEPGSALGPSWRVTFARPGGLLNADIGAEATRLNWFAVDEAGITKREVAVVPQAGDQYGNLNGVAAGDFNGDGRLDAIVAGDVSSFDPTGFSMACDRGASTWETAAGELPSGSHALRTIDVDGDGRDELLAISGGGDGVIYELR